MARHEPIAIEFDPPPREPGKLLPPWSWWTVPTILSLACAVVAVAGPVVVKAGASSQPSQLAGMAALGAAVLLAVLAALVGYLLGALGRIGQPQRGRRACAANVLCGIIGLAVALA